MCSIKNNLNVLLLRPQLIIKTQKSHIWDWGCVEACLTLIHTWIWHWALTHSATMAGLSALFLCWEKHIINGDSKIWTAHSWASGFDGNHSTTTLPQITRLVCSIKIQFLLFSKLHQPAWTPLWILWELVVYFIYCLGAAHSKCWSKWAFTWLSHEKIKKITRKKQ